MIGEFATQRPRRSVLFVNGAEWLSILLWLSQQPRVLVHSTATYVSWLNQVELWFGIITHRAIRWGCFSSVKRLIAKIEQLASVKTGPRRHLTGAPQQTQSWRSCSVFGCNSLGREIRQLLPPFSRCFLLAGVTKCIT